MTNRGQLCLTSSLKPFPTTCSDSASEQFHSVERSPGGGCGDAYGPLLFFSFCSAEDEAQTHVC
jgi:hypothetical protein